MSIKVKYLPVTCHWKIGGYLDHAHDHGFAKTEAGFHFIAFYGVALSEILRLERRETLVGLGSIPYGPASFGCISL